LRFKWDLTGVTQATNGGAYVRIGLGSGLNIGEDPVIDFIGFEAQFSAAAIQFRSMVAESGTWANVVTDTVPSVTTLYCEISRQSATVSNIKFFSDAAFSVQVGTTTAGVPSATVSALRYMRCHIFVGGAVSDGALDGTLDDFQFWDGVTTVPAETGLKTVDDDVATFWESLQETNPAVYVDEGESNNFVGVAIYWNANSTETEIQIRVSTDATFTAGEAVRTITTSNLTAGQYNFIRFNVAIGRYLQIFGNSGTSFVLAINEIKDLVKTDSEILADLGILTISPTDTSLALDGT